MNESSSRVAGEHHGARRAEQVADGCEPHDQQAAPVNRRQHRRQIAGRKLWTEEAMNDNCGGHDQQYELHCRAYVPPPEQRADDWQLEDIHSLSAGHSEV